MLEQHAPRRRHRSGSAFPCEQCRDLLPTRACYASPATAANLLEGKKGFSDCACAAVASAPGQGPQQRAAAVRNAEWTVSAKNISSLSKRSPAFVTSHFSTFKNWVVNFAVSSLLLLPSSPSPSPPPSRSQRFHAAERADCVSRTCVCPPLHPSIPLCTALACGDFFSWCNCPGHKHAPAVGFVKLEVLFCRARGH